MAQVYRKLQFNYSTKNIPIPSRDEYSYQLIHSVEKFVSNLRWRVKKHNDPNDWDQSEKFGFPSLKHPGAEQDLKQLELRLKAMVRNVEFRNFNNQFQEYYAKILMKISHVTWNKSS